jgi:hypothetical protein
MKFRRRRAAVLERWLDLVVAAAAVRFARILRRQHGGASHDEGTWSHLVQGGGRPWQELGGYAGADTWQAR